MAQPSFGHRSGPLTPAQRLAGDAVQLGLEGAGAGLLQDAALLVRERQRVGGPAFLQVVAARHAQAELLKFDPVPLTAA
jgi:hypothetical protein